MTKRVRHLMAGVAFTITLFPPQTLDATTGDDVVHVEDHARIAAADRKLCQATQGALHE